MPWAERTKPEMTKDDKEFLNIFSLPSSQVPLSGIKYNSLFRFADIEFLRLYCWEKSAYSFWFSKEKWTYNVIEEKFKHYIINLKEKQRHLLLVLSQKASHYKASFLFNYKKPSQLKFCEAHKTMYMYINFLDLKIIWIIHKFQIVITHRVTATRFLLRVKPSEK